MPWDGAGVGMAVSQRPLGYGLYRRSYWLLPAWHSPPLGFSGSLILRIFQAALRAADFKDFKDFSAALCAAFKDFKDFSKKMSLNFENFKEFSRNLWLLFLKVVLLAMIKTFRAYACP